MLTLTLTQQQWENMHLHVKQQAPLEACGLIGGNKSERAYKSEIVIPTKNFLSSPTRYQIDPQDQINAFLKLKRLGFELVAIYHSHPNGPAVPSQEDVEQAYYPEVVNLIWYMEKKDWKCLGYLIQNGIINRVELGLVYG